MSEHSYPIYPAIWTPTQAAPTSYTPDRTCANLLRTALMGGLIGGSAAAATNLRQVRVGTLASGPAFAATARAAAIGAVATAAAGAVAGAVAEQGLLRLGLMFAVGTAVVYGLEQWGDDALGDDDV